MVRIHPTWLKKKDFHLINKHEILSVIPSKEKGCVVKKNEKPATSRWDFFIQFLFGRKSLFDKGAFFKEKEHQQGKKASKSRQYLKSIHYMSALTLSFDLERNGHR